MKFGLKERDLADIRKAIQEFPEIKKTIIFGSRAIGNYKKGSDIDLALKGQQVSRLITTRLSEILNDEMPIPYFFDIVNYNSISNIELQKHINNEGKLLFSRE